MCSQRDALLQYGEYAAQLPKATERVSIVTALLECLSSSYVCDGF